MSYEAANADKLLGQFASGKGYADLIKATTSDYPALKSLVKNGASEDVAAVVADCNALAKATDDEDVKSTADALRGLIDGEDMVVITNGMLPDDD